MDVYKSGDAKRTALLCLVSTCMNLGENFIWFKGGYDLSDAHVVCLACHTIFADGLHEMVIEGLWPGSAGRRSMYLFHQDVFSI